RSLVLPELHAEFDGHWMRMTETRQPLAGLRIRNPRRDGIALVCEWTVTPLVNPEGNIVSVIAQGQDVTRQIEAERIKKEFTSTLSHELRTPLTSIIGSLQLVNSGVAGELSRDVSELTLVAERNAQRLLDIINDILDIEKIESGTISMAPEVLAIDGLVREAIVLNEGYGDRFAPEGRHRARARHLQADDRVDARPHRLRGPRRRRHHVLVRAAQTPQEGALMPDRPLTRICYVEDDEDIQRIVRMSLERVGK